MNKVTIGIDNGVSGSVGILSTESPVFTSTPIKESIHYTKARGVFNRIDVEELKLLINPFGLDDDSSIFAYVERPIINPKMFQATVSAARSYEATCIALEQLGIGYETIDSKQWQKEMLGPIKGSPALKKASSLKGVQLYPQFKDVIKKQKDADGLLIAHYYHNK